MHLIALNQYLNEILTPEQFKDYCPNGLQVEGKPEVQIIVTGVTASLDLLKAAHAEGADAILVHHGYFWQSEPAPIVGIKKHRIEYLLQHQMNLFAYHLPLDAHPKFGNNVMLGQQLGLQITGWLDSKQMVAYTKLPQPKTLGKMAAEVEQKLNRTPLVIGDSCREIQTVAWCTGAAQGYIDFAIQHQIDLYISGEISEQTVHSARETNTAYLAAGHHATERYGIRALGEHLAEKFNLKHIFIDVNNPV